MVDKSIRKIILRIERLENAILGSQKKLPSKTLEKFEGVKGGLLLLLSKGYFNKRRTAPAVKEDLKGIGYDYRIKVVQTALNRLSKNKGPLTAFPEGGIKLYVKRK